MYNVNTLKLTKHKLSKVRKIVLPVKKDFLKLAEKNVCGNIKNRILKKQNGNGKNGIGEEEGGFGVQDGAVQRGSGEGMGGKKARVRRAGISAASRA